ncbi:phosphatase PAP2 family protein [Corallococcus sp. M34]|uniref:phosphatase PAP2 family protein n=1 Tax=Citreicoccus inhibens TaxID=2849499 RepID=UPI001C24C571|nr:phosphatase PAP2 family protein [Citreicoccus inhibens]MBU8895904.1 phosphatase PAP2 family protein [Citreicoccus inhibens]
MERRQGVSGGSEERARRGAGWAGVVVCALGFLAIASAVSLGATQALDERAVLALRRPEDVAVPRGPRGLADAARDVTSLGGAPVLMLVTVGACGFLWSSRRRRDAVWLGGGVLLGWGLNTVFKFAVGRARPSVVPHLAEVRSFSFPSGHAMMSVIVYLTLAWVLLPRAEDSRPRAYLHGVALGLCLLIGVTRVFLGVHYPSDVLGGWLAGFAWMLALRAWAAGPARRPSHPGPEPARAPRG